MKPDKQNKQTKGPLLVIQVCIILLLLTGTYLLLTGRFDRWLLNEPIPINQPRAPQFIADDTDSPKEPFDFEWNFHSPEAPSWRTTPPPPAPIEYPFYVAEKRWNTNQQRYDFYRVGALGEECSNRQDARRYFLSENQANYPDPESGCGPTALLNLYIWYSKFGLLNESIRNADSETYKQLKFREIDQKILEIQKQNHRRDTGTNTMEQILAMDALIQENSQPSLRLHFEIKKPPLQLKDFLNLSRDYRVGLMSVRPLSPQTRRLMAYHTVLVIRGDTSGQITIANWGEFSHGRLIDKPDGQWFIPSDSSQHALKIVNLTTLIPFKPAVL